MSSFRDLLSPARRQEQMGKLSAQLAEAMDPKQKRTVDPRIWKPTVDSAGNGSAIIRFLDVTNGEEGCFVQRWENFLKGPTGNYYVNNSLKTFGKPDPAEEYYTSNRQVWSGDDEEAKQAMRDVRAKCRYYANVYIVKDPGAPENEGTVRIFGFGSSIMNKIARKENPGENTGLPKVNVFDMEKGANFHLIQVRKKNFPNYDESEFGPVCPIFVTADGRLDEKRAEKVWLKQHRLSDLLGPEFFKSYAELKMEFAKAMGLDKEEDVPFDMQEAPGKRKETHSATESDDDDIVLSDEDLETEENFESFNDLMNRA